MIGARTRIFRSVSFGLYFVCIVQYTVYSTLLYIKYLLVTCGEVLNSVLYNAVSVLYSTYCMVKLLNIK